MLATDSPLKAPVSQETNVSKAMVQAFILGFYSREFYERTAEQSSAENRDRADYLLRDRTIDRVKSREALTGSSRKRIASLDEIVDSKGICVSEPQDVADEFARLAGEWRMSRPLSSFVEDLVMHPAYQRIIGLGRSVVPHILQDLEQSPDHWFWALYCITGEDPVQESDAGNLRRMTDSWLQWGRAKGVI